MATPTPELGTAFLLVQQLGSPVVPLEDISLGYLGIEPQVAVRRFNSGTLGIHAFRLRSSRKAPLMVHVHDLAQLIDSRRAEAIKDKEAGTCPP